MSGFQKRKKFVNVLSANLLGGIRREDKMNKIELKFHTQRMLLLGVVIGLIFGTILGALIVFSELDSGKEGSSFPLTTMTAEDRPSFHDENIDIGLSCDFDATHENLIKFKENNPELTKYLKNQSVNKLITFNCDKANLEGIN